MAECFEKSHQAYARKDGASAKELSNQGKAHQRKMEQLNQEASDWIFTGLLYLLTHHCCPSIIFLGFTKKIIKYVVDHLFQHFKYL